MVWDGRNRRKFPRVFFPCLIKIRDTHNNNAVTLTHTENLSIDGVRVILKKSIKMDSIVNIEIDLMDTDEHLQCQGKVVWSEQRKSEDTIKPRFFDIGIEFIDVNGPQRKRLEAIVDHHIKQGKQI